MSNDERTRHFLCTPVVDNAQCLTKILVGVDNCVTKFQKEVYYSPPIFHISCASMLLDPRTNSTSTSASKSSDKIVVGKSMCTSSTEYVAVPRPVDGSIPLAVTTGDIGQELNREEEEDWKCNLRSDIQGS